MTSTKKMVAVLIVLAILLIGVGYAAITAVTLRISGTAEAEGNQANFTVEFVKEPAPETSGKGTISATVTDEHNAVLNVSDLTAKGDTAIATYTIQNTSADLSANLKANVVNGNDENFETTYSFGKTSLTHGDTTTLTVTVKLLKTPITDSVNTTIGVQITAEPVQPE